jgi:hypothetical protein
LQVATATTAPRYSDDLYRYVWDGRVQTHGIDPYRYVPVATRLAGLRDATLFPATAATQGHCVPSSSGITAGCTLLNRPLVHTIYPPVAEGYFTLAHWWGPAGIQAAAGAFAVAVTVFLLWALPRVGRDARLAVLWGWCPTVALEAGNGGHVDVVAVLLTGFALVLLARGRTAWGGVLLGLAVATKVTPALALPGALRRRPLSMLPLLGSVFGVVALVYVPHVLAVGRAAAGFLGGYLQEEGYDDGRRFALLDHLLPAGWVKPAAVLLLALAAATIWWRADPARPWRGALLMTGTAMLIAAPAYPWYAMLLVLFVAFEGWRGVPWLGVAMAGYVVQAGLGAAWGYGVAAGVVAAAGIAGGVLAAGRSAGDKVAAAGDSGLIRPRLRTLSTPGSSPLTSPPHPWGTTTLAPDSASNQPAVKTPAAESTPSEQPAQAAQSTQPGPIDVVLPCLNEAGALPYVLGRMPAGYRAIVVDNGSTDGSGEVARALGAVVVFEPRAGFGAACHAGLAVATAEVVCFLDCDGSFDPADLPRVTAAVVAGDADLVLGQRRPVGRGAWPVHARVANRVLARRIRREAGVAVRDLGPMRAARRAALLELGIVDRRFGYPLEMVLKAAEAGWRIAEVDVPYAPRTGTSKVTGTVSGTLKAVQDMRKVWKAATR